MIPNMNSASVFFAVTTTLAFPNIGQATPVHAATVPTDGSVVVISNARSRKDEEESDLDSFIASLEKDPELAAGLADARKWVADTNSDERKTLRHYRLSKGLSQTQLAKLVGMKQPNISAIESNNRVPDYSTASRLGNALGISVEEVFAALNR
jgi:DNA-binding XRE family transcriptional regulator